MKFFLQTKSKCSGCKRESVDIVSTDEVEGLLFSRHFLPGTFTFCGRSLSEYVRDR